ncbi:MAG TPA: N-acetyltransferase [Caulobacteraceae bacterium]
MRPASLADHAAIRAVLDAAFGEEGPSQIVDGVRAEGAALVELVVAAGDEIVGYVLFSRMSVTTSFDPPLAGHPDSEAAMQLPFVAGLGPVGVRPGAQNKGYGAELCRAGIEQLRAMGVDAVVVLGHETYYPRFGFAHEATRLITSPFGDREAFMALELTPEALARPLKIDYPAAFG